MEEESKSASNKQIRRKIAVNGGGLGGFLVLGGALAAAALIATFTNKASKRRPNTKNPETPTDPTQRLMNRNSSSSVKEGSEGLRSLLQTPSMEPHHCCSSSIEHGAPRKVDSSSTQMDFSELVAIETLITEIVCDISKDRVPLANFEEFSDTELLKQEVIIKEVDDDDSIISVEAVAVIREVELSETALVDKMVLEETPSMQLEEEDEEDDDESVEEEGGEEGSEGTADSSMESNAEAIWPAELIEEESLELKEMKTHVQIDEDKAVEEVEEEEEEEGKSMSIVKEEKGTRFMMMHYSPLIISSSRSCMWLMLAVGLLLLFLIHHLALSNYHLNDSHLSSS